MKILYCWRCQMDVPMLDDNEYRRIRKIEGELWGNKKAYGDLKAFKAEIERKLLDEYNTITGFNETNYLAIYHHRISIYGAPCNNCGKPLRTDKAKFCAACGWKKEL